jgi:hypothetical protein
MATEILRPNATGDEANIEGCVGGGDHYLDVDEETPDDSATRVYEHRASYYRDLYNLPAHSEGSGAINFVKVYFRCQGYTGRYAKPVLKSGSTVSEGSPQETNTSWTTFSEQWDTNPADGEAWEWDDIDALQVGVALISNGTNYISCTQLYVEVDYTSVTEKSSADSGTGVDAVESLETPEAKNSADSGVGAEGLPVASATLEDSEGGSSIEAIIARLLAADESGGGSEAAEVEDLGSFKDLAVSEEGEGSDQLVARIATPTKGGGRKLWI